MRRTGWATARATNSQNGCLVRSRQHCCGERIGSTLRARSGARASLQAMDDGEGSGVTEQAVQRTRVTTSTHHILDTTHRTGGAHLSGRACAGVVAWEEGLEDCAVVAARFCTISPHTHTQTETQTQSENEREEEERRCQCRGGRSDARGSRRTVLGGGWRKAKPPSPQAVMHVQATMQHARPAKSRKGLEPSSAIKILVGLVRSRRARCVQRGARTCHC